MTDDLTPIGEGPHPDPGRHGLSEGVKTLVATVVAVLAIAVGIALYVSHEHGSLRCTTPAPLTHLSTAPPVANFNPSTTFPPSRDNDSGRSRPPDATPDADNDVMRRSLTCH